MKKEENKLANWTTCLECKGQGKVNKGIKKSVRLRYLMELEAYKDSLSEGPAPAYPVAHLHICTFCEGSGLAPSSSTPIVNKEAYPHVAIIGGGIGGIALAVACLHRGIPFTIFERDSGFNVRHQGYGLTVQQGRRAIEGLGIFNLQEKIISTRHVVYATDGKVLGEWGMRKWLKAVDEIPPRRTNMQIARQSLRLALLNQLGGEDSVQWGHQLVDIKQCEGKGVELNFIVGAETKSLKFDLVVGADGIRSTVRHMLLGEEISPLRYLGCIVILGICKLSDIDVEDRTLLDSATIFQTANGNERIYIMPFTTDSVMWQLSFPMSEDEAKKLSDQGAEALRQEAIKRTQWHDPIPQILAATKASSVSGYPVYDRELLKKELLEKLGPITLIGDAAHPMSPFKGQGANQALLDGLELSRVITAGCHHLSNWKEEGLRKCVLTKFETEMLERSASKVKDSAEAAMFLHSDVVLHEANEPRGRILKRK